ncbi:MAG: hypothetical protein GW778_01440, partial [Alphaproteobacteria bacterium]|nr:hypothetical protein [Alphaproteobacteria bacterium]
MLCIHQHLFSRLFGVVVLLLGATTLVEYIFHVNFGIDNVFMEPVFLAKTTHPGRMAPNTALCFMLCGFVFALVRSEKALKIGASFAVLVLAFLSLLGYMVYSEGLYGWGSLTRMALHTASGFVIIGMGVIAIVLLDRDKKLFDFWQILPLSISLTIGVLAFFSAYALQENARAQNIAYLKTLISDTQDALINRYSLYEQSLRGGVGVYYASTEVTREDWRNYIHTLDADNTLPGINGIGYIDYVLAQDLNGYIQSVQNNDIPDFKAHPNTFYPDKFIIKYIEPVEKNIEAVGLDIGFEANRRAAAERARDLGVPALTKKILLVQDHQKQAGFLLLVPTYSTKSVPPSIEERRQHFQGWVYAPFLGANFFEGIGKFNKNQLYLEVFDGKKIAKDALIYVDPEYDQRKTSIHDHEKYISVTQIKIAGRIWTFEWHPTDEFAPPTSENIGLILLAFGLTFAGFLYYTLNQLLRSKALIQFRVKEQTAELKQAADFRDLITQTIPDFLFVKDSEFRIVDANEAFLSLYPEDIRADVIGSTTIEDYTPQDAEAFLENDKVALD